MKTFVLIKHLIVLICLLPVCLLFHTFRPDFHAAIYRLLRAGSVRDLFLLLAGFRQSRMIGFLMLLP